MSVPDDPFASTSPASSGQNTRPPTLTVTTPASGPLPNLASHSQAGTSGPSTGPGTGHKTPRRVQWTADHIVSIEPPGSPSSTLDEAGLEELRTALERHKSKSGAHPRANLLHHAHPAQQQDEEIDLAEVAQDDGEDYDYRLDTGPYPPAESIGSNAPSYETNQGDERDPLSSYPPTSASRFVHPSAQGHVPPPEDASGMAPDVRDQLAVFVDPGETDGMPSLIAPGADQADNAAAATALVKAHRTGRFGGFLRNRKNDAKGLLRKGQASNGMTSADEKGMNAFAQRYPDTDSAPEAQSSSAPKQALGVNASALRALGGRSGMGAGGSTGGGVLASLLALYDNGQNDRSGQSTPASSRPASIIVSDDSSDEERERREQERRRKKHDDRKGNSWAANLVKPKPRYPPGQGPLVAPRPPSSVGSTRSGTPDQRDQLSPTESTFGAANRSKSQTSLMSMGRENKDGRSSPNFVQQFKRAADRMGLDVDARVDRPKAARSGAGVMGALMASTANITGAATPAASALAPAAKRSGYRLSRFTIGDPSEAEANRRPVSDPPSRPASVAGGPIGRVSSHISVDAAGKEQDTSPSSGRTQVEAPAGDRHDAPMSKPGKNKPFSLKSFGSLTHLPLTPGSKGHGWMGGRSNPTSPAYSEQNEKAGDYFGEKMSRSSTFMSEDERKRKEWELEKKKRKKAKEKKKQQEIFIIQHVAAILARQQFILKLARAFMMFGSPSHRLEAQIQATARVLEINCQAVYFPGTCLISFGDEATHTSETKFLKQSTGLDLRNLLAVHHLYWKVVHDQISVEEASKEIDKLMTSKPLYNVYETLAIGGLCSAFICCIAFYGSFIDALISVPLGVLLIGIQLLAAKNDLYSNVFEITVAVINSFLAAALASTKVFCFTAVMSSSIVLILPGFIVLSGSLELASRNITSGSVRIAYSILYSLLLGFGISLGVTLYQKITSLDVLNVSDYTCAATHYAGAPWYMQTPSEWWYFLIAPAYSFCLSLRQAQPIFAKEMPAMVLISCAGWASNHFSARAFPNRSDITSLVGSFVVGILGNIWGKFFQGTSFVVMLVGILFQLPSGLSNGGILSFAATTESDTATTYTSGFQVAQQLVSISLGLTIGLFVAAVVIHPFGGGRRRGNGIFSF